MGKFEFAVTLTWSKIMALVIISLAFVIDIMHDKSGTVFMYSIPFAVALITGKQIIDRNKPIENDG
jgi:hypothetical protein